MKTIFCTALILLGAFGVFAQERTISKEEFDAVLKHPNRFAAIAWRGKTYRWTFTSEAKLTGNKTVDTSGKHITEFTPNQVSRSVRELRDGTKITKSETIRTKDKIYDRNENRTWTVKAVEEKPKTTNNNPPPTPSADKTEQKNEYKFLGTEKIKEQVTDVYLWIFTSKTTDPSGNIVGSSTQTRKFWFNEDGTAVKEEWLVMSQFQRDTVKNTFYNRVTQMYELDPNISIEVPNVN